MGLTVHGGRDSPDSAEEPRVRVTVRLRVRVSVRARVRVSSLET